MKNVVKSYGYSLLTESVKDFIKCVSADKNEDVQVVPVIMKNISKEVLSGNPLATTTLNISCNLSDGEETLNIRDTNIHGFIASAVSAINQGFELQGEVFVPRSIWGEFSFTYMVD